jgi:hypothetical protein
MSRRHVSASCCPESSAWTAPDPPSLMRSRSTVSPSLHPNTSSGVSCTDHDRYSLSLITWIRISPKPPLRGPGTRYRNWMHCVYASLVSGRSIMLHRSRDLPRSSHCAVPAPRVVGSTTDAAHAGPAILMTCVPGHMHLMPRDRARWLPQAESGNLRHAGDGRRPLRRRSQTRVSRR